MIKYEQTSKIGYLGKFHGLNGEINFHMDFDGFTTNPEYLILDIEGILVPFFIESIRYRNNQQALIKFIDIDSHDKMPFLQSCDVYCPVEYKGHEDFLPQIENNDYLWENIIGYNVKDEKGNSIGTIKDIDSQTINILLLIEKLDNNNLIIPAVHEWIINLDNTKKEISLNLPEGLI